MARMKEPDRSMNLTQGLAALREQLAAELTGNILPFWMNHAVDRVNGGFHGAITHDRQIRRDVPRSAILCARILWTYAAVYRQFADENYLAMARHAYDYLARAFWDQEHGGLYWSVDEQGRPLSDRKHHYAQAFGIYGLSEYYRASHEPRCLELAQELFRLLQARALDPVHGGYIEGSSRDWQTLANMRLSHKEINCRKSMNTMLHILEAYTNLGRIWPDPRLLAQHQALIELFLDHIIDPQSGHFRLFFDDDWSPLSPNVSYGHDIEGSWLLWEAGELHDNPQLSDRLRPVVIQMAEAIYREGRDDDGSLFYEAGPQGLVDDNKSWWVHAEAMVGFYNAYQLSGREYFAQAAVRCWQYIQAHFVDRAYGGWYKQLDRLGRPDLAHFKAGPWDCPYHHGRACLEMMHRLPAP
jgi:mannobiose 2-epimerase